MQVIQPITRFSYIYKRQQRSYTNTPKLILHHILKTLYIHT